MIKKMTNAQIVGTIRLMGDEFGEALFQAKLPVKILYALRKSYLAVADAYKVYEATLTDICKRYGTTIDKAAAGGQECLDEVQELLNTETEVNIHTITVDTLESLDDDRYDALTFQQLDRLNWIVQDPTDEKKDDHQTLVPQNQAQPAQPN